MSVIDRFLLIKGLKKVYSVKEDKGLPDINHIFPASNQKIEVVEVAGGLVGNGALELQTHLYRCLEEGRCYQILDFDNVSRIDGLGISILEHFMSRGLQIRLIHVKPEIQGIIRIAKKEYLLNIIYKDYTKAASLFEKDISEKKVIPGEGLVEKRQHIRVNTAFPSEFKYCDNGEVTLCNANILNLSEGGVLAGQIVAVNKNTQEPVKCQGMAKRKIYDFEFKLDGDVTSITTQGVYVREFMSGESLYAGMRFNFNDISRHQKKTIRSFVDTHK